MEAIRSFFNTGVTKDLLFRIQQLDKLEQAIKQHSNELLSAMKADLGKSPEEAYLTEISIVLNEIRYHKSHLKRWAKPKRLSSGLVLFPSKSRILYEPFGLVLIIAPWNYPFQLLLDPLVGAISAGNCAVLKPSQQSPSVSKVISNIIGHTFDPNYIRVVEGNREALSWLPDYPFDYIFFTGGLKAGRTILEKAAKNLIPCTLEMGGKSPCIVSPDFDVQLAAKRIVFGKFINAGQTCVAPDYVLVEKNCKEALIEALKQSIHEFYGVNVKASPHYGRIASDRFFLRLIDTMTHSGGEIVEGGEAERDQRYLSPTIIDHPSTDSALMQDEIFGPLLPILTYETIEEAIRFVNVRKKPLALYYFGNKKEAAFVLKNTTSGGACVNDTILHVANKKLPFGGVGESGMGKYHGKTSFYLFSNERSVLISSKRIDFPVKYPPYKQFDKLKKFL
ncbi:MAG: aldehyde dehydrogenase [Bacteroidota bacterium]|nr:aldehyde dehydrogenase [Bacteroidota bacterium]